MMPSRTGVALFFVVLALVWFSTAIAVRVWAQEPDACTCPCAARLDRLEVEWEAYQLEIGHRVEEQLRSSQGHAQTALEHSRAIRGELNELLARFNHSLVDEYLTRELGKHAGGVEVETALDVNPAIHAPEEGVE